GEVVSEAFRIAWNWIVNLFKEPTSPNMFLAGDPSVSDQIAYKATITRTTHVPYTLEFQLKHESQTITAISVLPINRDLQSPEVDIVEGGINWRHVKLCLSPAEEGRWGCDIKICGTPPPST
ncbi:hypothetical protein L9F63_022200, partial [Diploptera punctata]